MSNEEDKEGLEFMGITEEFLDYADIEALKRAASDLNELLEELELPDGTEDEPLGVLSDLKDERVYEKVIVDEVAWEIADKDDWQLSDEDMQIVRDNLPELYNTIDVFLVNPIPYYEDCTTSWYAVFEWCVVIQDVQQEIQTEYEKHLQDLITSVESVTLKDLVIELEKWNSVYQVTRKTVSTYTSFIESIASFPRWGPDFAERKLVKTKEEMVREEGEEKELLSKRYRL